ncbi:unnamed protein product [Symbiodinium sp. CCMP2592]|nr:unnamed protein product [Symbiodinium sp. CCMP2592]
MAPETAEEREDQFKAVDVWSAAVTLHQLASGSLLFGLHSGSTQLQLCSLLSCIYRCCSPMPPESARISQNIWRVVRHMLHVDPYERISMHWTFGPPWQARIDPPPCVLVVLTVIGQRCNEPVRDKLATFPMQLLSDVVRITGGRLALIEEEQILDDGGAAAISRVDDNRLRVERDELQHAQQEKERQKVERKEAFESKLRKLRRNAAGEPAMEESEPTLPVATSAPSGASAPPRVRERKDEGDAYGKYGVTKSGLKQAEEDLDKSLRGKGPVQGRSYWGKEGLGSGPHINLFEEAELAVKQQEAAHSKLLRYQETNNNLAEKGKKRPLSEFDEMTQEKPWYLEVQARGPDEDGEDPKLQKKWSRKHDQLILKVVERKKEASTALALGCESAEARGTLLDEECRGKHARSESRGKQAKDKKTKRRKEKKRKKGSHDDEALSELRKERQLREEAERRRAAELRPLFSG